MNAALRELLALRGHSTGNPPVLTGNDPVYSTHYRVCETGAAVLGAIGTAVTDIWELKTGRRQDVSVNIRAAGAALNSASFLERKDEYAAFQPMNNSPLAQAAYQITQPWQTKDGRWLLPHFGIAHLKTKMLKLLDCEATPQSVAQAVARWDAQPLENAIADIRACGGIVRSNAEWLGHPHGQALAEQPVVVIEKIGESDPEPFPSDGPALAGIRVLDLTRILAGPVAARSCAEHGADVLMVGARGIPQIKNFVIDLSTGKRSCFLDLNDESEAAQLRELVRTADVFSQGYRPGVLANRGFGPADLAALRPGLVYASISCFGPSGPYQDRAGWEQIAQCMVGICHDSGHEKPTLLPIPACDYLTGYLGAYGILVALARRAVEGGSYHVNVSLCQSGMFLYRQGRVAYEDQDMGLSPDEVAPMRLEWDSPYGTIRSLGPVTSYSESNPHYRSPPPALGSARPIWLS